jgi:hypothetical protein
MMHTGFDFIFLREQLDDRIVVEDPEVLAELAMLVPDLMMALDQVQDRNDHLTRVLDVARTVILNHSVS